MWEALDSEVDYGGGNRHKCSRCSAEFYGYGRHYETVVMYTENTRLKLAELDRV